MLRKTVLVRWWNLTLKYGISGTLEKKVFAFAGGSLLPCSKFCEPGSSQARAEGEQI